MNKIYFVESELYPKIDFANESDRNEMALALWQEHCYFLAMRAMNWYDEPIMSGIEEDASSNVFTWECQTWFDVPTQVAWFDEDYYRAGIAYQDEIICACCGGISSIDEIIEFAPAGVTPIVVYENWADFTDEIIGEKERSFSYEED